MLFTGKLSMLTLEIRTCQATTKFSVVFSGSADEDSGVGGSPGSSSRPATHNCNLCSKKFSRADILKKHVKTHVSSSCTVCGQIFNDKVALAKHQVEVGHYQIFSDINLAERREREISTIKADCSVWPSLHFYDEMTELNEQYNILLLHTHKSTFSPEKLNKFSQIDHKLQQQCNLYF